MFETQILGSQSTVFRAVADRLGFESFLIWLFFSTHSLLLLQEDEYVENRWRKMGAELLKVFKGGIDIGWTVYSD